MDKQATPDPVKARMFAEIAHAGQTYNDEVPYSFHLENVVGVLSRFGITRVEFVCAGWLHDCIEDTNRSYNDIKSRFGDKVAEMVYAVTSELGRNRKERNAKTYPKLQDNVDALCLKLADRIANVEYGAASDGKNDMYKKEYKEFREILFNENHPDVIRRMWKHLDKLLSE